MTIQQAIDFGKNKLNTDTPLLDAQVLLMHSANKNNLNLNKVKLYTEPDLVLSEKIQATYKDCIERRLKNEPVQYIVGECEFMGLNFDVNKYTLIPRPDTEILVENAIKYINENNKKNILDMCTGSGAIAISICTYCKDINMSACDISEKAVETAIINAKKNGVVNQINFTVGNLFEPIKRQKFDVILSNPPYIPTQTIETLEENVKKFEPLSALDGGNDGLYFYREIIQSSKKYLNGRIYFEIGYDQKDFVEELLSQNNFYNINTIKDLNNLNRVVYADYNN